MEKYKLEKDEILKKWVVWKKVGLNAWNQIFASSQKKDCESFIKKQNKFKKTLKHIEKELDKEVKRCLSIRATKKKTKS